MADRYQLDTDIVIDYLHGRSEAVTFVEGLTEVLLVSALTVAELYAGLVDATIAATAESEGAILVTLNRKHFPMITNLLVPYQKP